MTRSRFSVVSNHPLNQECPLGGVNSYLNFIQKQRGASQPILGNKELFFTADRKMKKIQDQLMQFMSKNTPLLISGEKGTGKSLLIEALYNKQFDHSTHRPPCITFDAAENRNTKQEHILLGEAAAHTSAAGASASESLLQQAQGGYLVIKNFTQLSLNLQNKLLKIIQLKDHKKYLGTQGVVPRFIFVTQAQVINLVEKNKIKSELYQHLTNNHIHVPPLRQRPQDIAFLSELFLAEMSQAHGAKISLSGGAMATLSHYEWPENITELKQVLMTACERRSSNRLDQDSLSIKQETREVKPSGDWIKSLPVGEALRTVETHFILETIKAHQGNRTYAARTLGISLRTLRNKINEFTVEGYEVMSPQSGRRSSATA